MQKFMLHPLWTGVRSDEWSLQIARSFAPQLTALRSTGTGERKNDAVSREKYSQSDQRVSALRRTNSNCSRSECCHGHKLHQVLKGHRWLWEQKLWLDRLCASHRRTWRRPDCDKLISKRQTRKKSGVHLWRYLFWGSESSGRRIPTTRKRDNSCSAEMLFWFTNN